MTPKKFHPQVGRTPVLKGMDACCIFCGVNSIYTVSLSTVHKEMKSVIVVYCWSRSITVDLKKNPGKYIQLSAFISFYFSGLALRGSPAETFLSVRDLCTIIFDNMHS